MEIADLVRVDELWQPTQPYMAAQIMAGYGRQSGATLELGPFAGGIAMELKKQYPQLDITIADEQPEIVNFLKNKIAEAGFADEIAIRQTDLNRLAFEDNSFDLVVFRGAFFFLREKERLLDEIFRIMKKGGFAFVGGGHGKGVPKGITSSIAGELRRLHGKLGGKWLGIEELKEILDKTHIKDKCRITEEGGVWLNIRK
jgi:SAM-dependent methyltransferase